MSFNFSSIEHAIASVCADVVKAAKAVAHALSKVADHEKEVEDLTAAIYPAAVPIERAAFAVLGVVLKAVNDADGAASAGGTNVQLDAQLVKDLRELLPAVKAQAAAFGVKI